MRAGAGLVGVSLALVLLLSSCAGKTDTSGEEGSGGSASPYPFEFPDVAQTFCDELFAGWDGCGRRDRETCLSVYVTDGYCDDEEEALLDCLVYGDGYECNHDVVLTLVGECRALAAEADDCQDGR